MSSRMSAFLAVFAALALAGCNPPPPEWVWVPSDSFEAVLRVSAGDGSGEAFGPGEWITLHADRSTGPWKKVRYRDLAGGARWMRNPPPAEEHDVEANVRWHAEPGGSHEFNIPTALDIATRKVRFNRPGKYRVWAETGAWIGANVESNVIEVTIVQ